MGFRRLLHEHSVLATFVGANSPEIVEILCATGFDAVCIDAEHGAFSSADLEGACRAAAAAGSQALVRVDGIPQIAHALDAGAVGVVVPQVESAAQAHAVVDAVRYPPLGHRGAGIGRAAGYGTRFLDYLATANDDIAAIVQIETVAGLAEVRSIAAVEGLDGLFIGPGDLSVSLGVPPGSPEHLAAMDEIAAAAREFGVPLGLWCPDVAAVERWAARGARFFLVSGDLGMLAAAGAQVASAAHAAIDAAEAVTA